MGQENCPEPDSRVNPPRRPGCAYSDGVIAHDPGIVRLLASPGFRRSRLAAAGLVDDPKALEKLMATVDAHRFSIDAVGDVTRGIDLDIACAVVEARIEELHESPAARAAPSCVQSARLRMVVAGLHYLVTEHDGGRPSDAGPPRHTVGDAAILRWITGIAQGEISAR